MSTNRENLTSRKYGRLTVIRPAGHIGGRTAWECQCNCGNTVIVKAYNLKSGETKSCGCLHKEMLHKPNLGTTKHGFEKDPLYNVWKNLISRCNNPKDKSFQRYGARGISVCREWAEDVGAFIEWARDSGYREGLQIDRKDNDGPYSPENCRWATRKENCRNTRRNVIITVNGISKTQAEWCEVLGCEYYRLDNRKRMENKVKFIQKRLEEVHANNLYTL